jgi:hypothetical protein
MSWNGDAILHPRGTTHVSTTANSGWSSSANEGFQTSLAAAKYVRVRCQLLRRPTPTSIHLRNGHGRWICRMDGPGVTDKRFSQEPAAFSCDS